LKLPLSRLEKQGAQLGPGAFIKGLGDRSGSALSRALIDLPLFVGTATYFSFIVALFWNFPGFSLAGGTRCDRVVYFPSPLHFSSYLVETLDKSTFFVS
jgi:hypothetical protein